MISFFYDVKILFVFLVGYLEVVESKIVVGEEKDEYIYVVFNKVYYLKNFVENLFEWVKLDFKE